MTHLVPWESWQQWHHVRSCFFSNSPARIAEALDRVSVWQSRGVLPMAVEMTTALVSIQQRDSHVNTDLPPSVALPADMLRMMYSMAIVRFVDVVMGSSIRRNTSSGTSRAEEVRLPRIFLDIRHETSQNELPSLPLVRRACKQALAWLQKYYWEDQEHLLPDTQDSLKTKLIEHAQVIYEILVTQQRLSSKEPKGQEYNLQRWTLKRAIKGMKRQQQTLLRELLELLSSGTSELASLLVKQGLLIHDLSPSCSSRMMPRSEFLDFRNSSNFEGVQQSTSLCDNLGPTAWHESNSVGAWKHTCAHLADHMPQLPSLLLSSIIETLATVSHDSISKMESKDNMGASMTKGDLLEWATWILDQSSALSKKKKAPSGIPEFIESSANVQMHAEFPQDSLKELGHLCLRSRMDKACLVQLVTRISALVNDCSFRRCVELLERCTSSCPVGGNFQDVGVDVNMNEVGRNCVCHESRRSQNKGVKELESETALIKATELQQMSMSKYVASVRALECSNLIKPQAIAGPWSQGEQWTPCAIRSVPSACGNEATICPTDLKPSASASYELGYSGEVSEFTHEAQSVRFKLSSVVGNHCNGQDFKRKTFQAQTEGTPQVLFKRKRLEDQPMIEETRIVIHDKGTGSDGDEEHLVLTDDTGGMDCDGECSEPMDEDHAFLDDDTSGKVVHCIDESDSNCPMDHRPLNISPKSEEVTVTCQGCILQGSSSLQELPNLQSAIRVL